MKKHFTTIRYIHPPSSRVTAPLTVRDWSSILEFLFCFTASRLCVWGRLFLSDRTVTTAEEAPVQRSGSFCDCVFRHESSGGRRHLCSSCSQKHDWKDIIIWQLLSGSQSWDCRHRQPSTSLLLSCPVLYWSAVGEELKTRWCWIEAG